jgi:hypothetical protein
MPRDEVGQRTEARGGEPGRDAEGEQIHTTSIPQVASLVAPDRDRHVTAARTGIIARNV